MSAKYSFDNPLFQFSKLLRSVFALLLWTGLKIIKSNETRIRVHSTYGNMPVPTFHASQHSLLPGVLPR